MHHEPHSERRLAEMRHWLNEAKKADASGAHKDADLFGDIAAHKLAMAIKAQEYAANTIRRQA